MTNKMLNVKQQQKGIYRWKSALINSYYGLLFGFKNEAAIREEIIALFLSVPLSIMLVESGVLRVILVLSVLIVLIVEVLNSAIEATIDRISLEQHPLSKAAKDLGSLSVLLAMIMAVTIWVAVIWL